MFFYFLLGALTASPVAFCVRPRGRDGGCPTARCRIEGRGAREGVTAEVEIHFIYEPRFRCISAVILSVFDVLCIFRLAFSVLNPC